jgi:hypothetical protein
MEALRFSETHKNTRRSIGSTTLTLVSNFIVYFYLIIISSTYLKHLDLSQITSRYISYLRVASIYSSFTSGHADLGWFSWWRRQTAFSDIAPCCLVQVDRRFRGASRPDDVCSTHFRSGGLLHRDYSYCTWCYNPIRLSSAYLPPWEREMSGLCGVPESFKLTAGTVLP